MSPAQAIANPKNAALPHWPGETHTPPVKSIIATRPKLVGLKRCFPFHRMRNFDVIVITAARTATRRRFVRSKRQSERPEIKALFGSKTGSFQIRVQAYCAVSAVPKRSRARPGEMSKERQVIP